MSLFKLCKQKNNIQEKPEYIFNEEKEIESNDKNYKYYRIALMNNDKSYSCYIFKVNYSLDYRYEKEKYINGMWKCECIAIDENGKHISGGTNTLFDKLYDIWQKETVHEKNTPIKCTISESQMTKEILSSWKPYLNNKIHF